MNSENNSHKKEIWYESECNYIQLERARLSGVIFAGSVNNAGDIAGHKGLTEAYEAGIMCKEERQWKQNYWIFF